jgi:hypothetical protein
VQATGMFLNGTDILVAAPPRAAIVASAASGGVGTLAIQFAKFTGGRVLATASALDGVELVRDMCAVNDVGLALLQLECVLDPLERSEPRGGDRAGMFEIKVLGNMGDLVGRDGDILSRPWGWPSNTSRPCRLL